MTEAAINKSIIDNGDIADGCSAVSVGWLSVITGSFTTGVSSISSSEPGILFFNSLPKDFCLPSGLLGCLMRTSCLPLLSSTLAIFSLVMRCSGRLATNVSCSLRLAPAEAACTSWLPLLAFWLTVPLMPLEAALSFLILTAEVLPLRELWVSWNSTSSPTLTLDDSLLP